MERKEVPGIHTKNLPGTVGRGSDADWSTMLLQVPVVAPAGFRSPGEVESGAVPPAWSPGTGFGHPGERFRMYGLPTGLGIGLPPRTCQEADKSAVRGLNPLAPGLRLASSRQ